MDGYDLTWALEQMLVQQDQNDCYMVFENAGEQGFPILLRLLRGSNEKQAIIAFQFLRRLLLLDKRFQTEILLGLLDFVENNVNSRLRLTVLGLIADCLFLFPNKLVARQLLILLFDEDTDLALAIAKFVGKGRIQDAIPHLTVLLDAGGQIRVAAQTALLEIDSPVADFAFSEWQKHRSK